MPSPTNDRWEVTILGSGTCVPSLERSACAVLMETGSRRLLFDIGPGTMRRLMEAGHSIFDIDYLFLSHFHPDHCGELVSFLFANKYPDADHRQTVLTMVGGTGFKSFFQELNRIFQGWIDLPGKLEVIELDANPINSHDFGEFTLTCTPAAHRPESLAFRVDTPRGSAVYTGDTDFSEQLIDLARGTDLLICESALPDAIKVEGHLTPSLAGEMAARAEAKSLVLTHFYPECDQADIVSQCRKTYDGPLRLAYDLMKIQLSP